MRAAVVALALIVASGVAEATPSSDLNRGRKSFQNADWNSAISVLLTLLYPTVQLGTQDEVVEAFVLFGASYFELGNRARARQEFERALQIDPEREITTNAFSTGAVQLFDDTKAEMQKKAAADAERRKLAEKIAALEEYKKHLVEVEVHHYAYNFVPFGAGQFQNHDSAKGILFATGEGLTFAASVGSWLYLVNKYGINCPNCVKAGDRGTALNLQQLEIGAGIAFFGLYAWGVVDALRHYKPEERLKDDHAPHLDLRDLDAPAPKKKTSFLDHLHLAPMITPQSVGIGLGWEN
ncbi:MAG: hypothetical protein JWO36_5192 [Myxococcales bacterium]|nr:hypothetical protein [Myxococcales bacterium]